MLTARRGSVLRYSVRLFDDSASVPFRFVRCPAYDEVLRAGNDYLAAPGVLAAAGPRETYVLDCRSVGWLRPNGRSGVAFAMRLHVPAHAHLGVNTLAWHLLGSAWNATDAVRVVVKP
jgi:hypothetical protein